MAEFLSPGVYVLEESSGIKPIEGVGTSTAGLVGITERGPVGEPVLITNFEQYVRVFGGFVDVGLLPFAVYQFFLEGGKRCYVVRAVHFEGDPAVKTSAAATAEIASQISFAANSDGTWANTVKDGSDNLINGLEVDIKEATIGGAGYFRIDVYHLSDMSKTTGGDTRILVESYDELTIDNVIDTVNSSSNYLNITAATALTATLPVTLQFSNGNDGIDDGSGNSTLTIPDFVGNPTAATRNGLLAFDIIDEVNIIAIPDASNVYVDTGAAPPETLDGNLGQIMKGGMSYCENRGDCFFIADPVSGLDITGVKDFKSNALLNSTYGALYYPWLQMSHPQDGKTVYMPPSGAIAGIIARTDNKVGVHKAPAGLATGAVNSANGVLRIVTSGEQDILNPNGINVIKPIPNSGLVVWGARTVSTDAEWRYVNVRRLFLFVEESIDEGTQWVVFEPNSPELWGTVKRNLTVFLTTVWRSGALFGNTPEEAFYVKVDEENNPSSERDLGRLNIEVGIAPVKPAEFVIIRISQKTLTS